MTDEILLDAKMAREQGDYATALALCNEVLDKDPNNPQALFIMGAVFIDTQKKGMAYNILTRCLSLAPDRPEIWNNYGRVQSDDKDGWDISEACFQKALELKPNFRAAMSNMSSLEIQRCNPEEGLKWAEDCLELYPEDQVATSCKGFASFFLGKWEDGFKAYHAMLGHRSRPLVQYGDLPEWDGTKGKTVFVNGEQGIGDELVYSSMLNDMSKDCTVIYDCMPRLKNLMQRSFPNVHVIGSRWDDHVEIPVGIKPDAQITQAGVGMFYRKTDEDFDGKPYLKADEEMKVSMRALLDSISSRPKVGIAWTGGTERSRCHFRQESLESLLPILRGKHCDFISLQYNDPSDKIKAFKKKNNIEIHHFPWITEEKNYDFTAALVSELDLVIGVPTSVNQLAGGLGVNAWVLVPEITGWLYYRDKYVWADSVSLFHDWNPKQISENLRDYLDGLDSGLHLAAN